MNKRCHACGKDHNAQKYLCWNCWWSLRRPTRTALLKRDHQTFGRARELYDAIDAGTALNEITVTL